MDNIKEITKDCGLVREVDKDINNFLMQNGGDLTPFMDDFIGYDKNGKPISHRDVFSLSVYLFGSNVLPRKQYKVLFYCNAFGVAGNPFKYVHKDKTGMDSSTNYIIDYKYCPVRNKNTGELLNPYHFEFNVTDEQGNRLPREVKSKNEVSFLPKEVDTKAVAKEYLSDMADFIINMLGNFLCYNENELTAWDDDKTGSLIKLEPKRGLDVFAL